MKRQIGSMVSALVRGANDKDKNVKKSVADSLLAIGRAEPNLILEKCYDFVEKNKLGESHTIALLDVITSVSEISLNEIEEELSMNIIDLALSEMTKESTVNSKWQTAASRVLVCYGTRYPHEIVDKLLELFPPGEIPHYFVLKTIGDLSIANAVDVVPRIGDLLSRIIPVLASLKWDNMRWVFANSLKSFCEAMVSYQADAEKVEVDISSFSPQIFTAFEVFLTSPDWIQSSEKQVRVACIQAIGSMSTIISTVNFSNQFLNLLKSFINMYSKESVADHLAITQGLYNILTVALKHCRLELENEITWLLDSLMPQICRPIDYTVASTLKNNNELFRCFEILTIGFTDTLLGYLLEKLEDPNYIIREATLFIMKHNITRIKDEFEYKREIMLAGMQAIIQTETHYRVKKALAQVIISMAPKKYLSLEGGERMIEFIILNSSISDEEIEKYKHERAKIKKPSPEDVSPTELRNMCDHILSLMTTTIPEMQEALWPYLLEPIVSEQFVPAMSVLTKCIAHISEEKKLSGDKDYFIDFEKQVNLPKPTQIISRFFVLLNFPKRRGNIGINVLNSMKSLGAVLHPAIGEYWENRLTEMTDMLSNDFNQKNWEFTVIDLLRNTLDLIETDKLVVKIADSFFNQIVLHTGDDEARNASFKFIGVTLGYISNEAYIRDTLRKIFDTTNHSSDVERSGCSQCYGYASIHTDIVLNLLEEQIDGKSPPQAVPEKKKSGGFFSKIFAASPKSEKKKDLSDSQLCTVIGSYAYIIVNSDINTIFDIIEDKILSKIRQRFVSTNVNVQKSIINFFDLISKKILAKDDTFVLEQRDEFVNVLISILERSEADPSETWKLRVLVINALSNLSVLQPTLVLEVENSIVSHVAPLLRNAPSEAETASIFLETYNRLFLTILKQDCVMECLNRLLNSQIGFTTGSAVTKQHALVNMINLYKHYLKVIKAEENGKPDVSKFQQLGYQLGFMIPRCTDPVRDIRGLAVEAIQIIVYIDHLLKKLSHENPEGNTKPPANIASISAIKKRLRKIDDVNEQYTVVHHLSSVIAEIVEIEEIEDFVKQSLNGLMDPQLPCARGTCILLFGLFTAIGEKLDVPLLTTLENLLLDKLVLVTNDQVILGAMNALKCLSIVNIDVQMDVFLARKLPFHQSITNTIQFIFKDQEMAPRILKYLTNTLNSGEIFEEIMETEQSIPSALSQAATVALSIVFKVPEIPGIEAYFPVLFATLLLRIGSSRGHDDVMEQTIDAIRNWLNAMNEMDIVEKLEIAKTYGKLKGTQFVEGVAEFTGIVIKPHVKSARSVFKILSKYIGGESQDQTIVCIFALGEFLNHSDDSRLIEHIVNSLLPCISENKYKNGALKGLGNIVSAPEDQYNKYAATILDALMERIDDSDFRTSLEAINSLSKLLEVVEPERVIPFLGTLMGRIIALFDSGLSQIREASIRLFEGILKYGEVEETKSYFYEGVQTIFPTVILRINDSDAKVRRSSRSLFKAIVSQFLKTEELETIISTNYIFSVEKDVDYHDFLRKHLSKVLVSNFPRRITFYLDKCIETYFGSDIKGSAALFVGTLMLHISNNDDTVHSLEVDPIYISKELVTLLKDPNSDVRLLAAESLSMLQNY